MEVYFVVLQLPGSKELKFREGNHSPDHFWSIADENIRQGHSKIVSIRQDTGISEELRSHIEHKSDFETYLLFYLTLEKDETKDKKLILSKASDLLKVANYEEVIDSDEHFQLVTLDYLEDNDHPINLNSSNEAWSA